MFRLVRLLILAAIAITVAIWINESDGSAPAPNSTKIRLFEGESL